MLTLAMNAISVVKRMTSHSPDPDQAGLRIAEGDDDDTLSIEVAPSPVRETWSSSMAARGSS